MSMGQMVHDWPRQKCPIKGSPNQYQKTKEKSHCVLTKSTISASSPLQPHTQEEHQYIERFSRQGNYSRRVSYISHQ